MESVKHSARGTKDCSMFLRFGWLFASATSSRFMVIKGAGQLPLGSFDFDTFWGAILGRCTLFYLGLLLLMGSLF